MLKATATIEDYLGAVYRLREAPEVPLPLSQLQEHFSFSRVSVHEMIQKLAQHALISYHPYRGVTLTDAGESIAAALVRRHRLWERFLTDMLHLPWDEAHEIAEQLEHAAPEAVTEGLAGLLGDPGSCPHGGPIPPSASRIPGAPLNSLASGNLYAVIRVFPEQPEILHQLGALNIGLHTRLQVLFQTGGETVVSLPDGRVVTLPAFVSSTIWALPVEEHS